MDKPQEYEFKMPDGSWRTEMIYVRADIFRLQDYLKATCARPVQKPGGGKWASEDHS